MTLIKGKEMTDQSDEKEVASNISPLTQAALDWVDGNAQKNAGATKERNSAKVIKNLVTEGSQTIEVNKNLDLVVGWQEDESEEIDPKLLLEKHPLIFWQIISFPMGAVTDLIGDKEAAKITRPVTTNTFKVKKIKK